MAQSLNDTLLEIMRRIQDLERRVAEMEAEETILLTRPSITGSRGGNAALADLLIDLDQIGLIDDQTTA